MPSLPHLLASTVLSTWLANSADSWRRLPRPRGEPLIVVPGDDPYRGLVVGSGAAVGYGVLEWALSVNGQVARQVAGATGRGVELRVIADPELSVRAARKALVDADLTGYDVVIVTVGALDALELLPSQDWGTQLGRLLDTIAVRASTDARVLVMGIPNLTELVTIPRLYRGAVARRCAALNEETALLASAREGVAFVPFAPPAIDLVHNASRDVHNTWARIVVPAVLAALRA